MADATMWQEMTTKELEAALPKIQAEKAALDPHLQDAKVSAAKAVVSDLNLALVIKESKANQDALAKARWALEQAAEERETAADRLRVITEAEEAIRNALRQRRTNERQERQRTVVRALQDRLVADSDLVRERLLDAATWIAVSGTAPTEFGQLVAVLEKCAGIDLHDLFRESRRRAEQEMSAASLPVPKTPKQEAAP